MKKIYKYIFIIISLALLNAKSIVQVFYFSGSEFAFARLKCEIDIEGEQEDIDDEDKENECEENEGKENECKSEPTEYYSIAMPITFSNNMLNSLSLKKKYDQENSDFFSRSISNIPYCPPELSIV